MRWLGGGLAALLLFGCSAVKMTRLRPDYATNDRDKVKRLVVVTEPLPEGNPKLGELWSLIGRRYTNQKRDFIAKKNVAVAADPRFSPVSQCGEGIEGVLWLSPAEVKREGSGVEASVDAKLVRCPDGEEVWAAKAAGSWSSNDALLTDYTAQYTREVGAEVEPYVAPTFRLLKAILDTLPNPTLTDADQDEKIQLDD